MWILTDPSSTLDWLETHSGAISLIALIFAVLSALFKPAIWRRVVATILAGLVGLLFLPYDTNSPKIWGARALLLACVFACAFWWLVGRYHAWRTTRTPLPAQPSGTFESIVDSVRRFPGDSNVSVRVATSEGTLSITKKPVDRPKE
jgi:hypothetical protein